MIFFIKINKFSNYKTLNNAIIITFMQIGQFILPGFSFKQYLMNYGQIKIKIKQFIIKTL